MKRSAALLLVLLLALVGCGSTDTSSADAGTDTSRVVSASEAKELIAAKDVMVIDVRTPQEFSAGHVVGATNIDVESPDFAQRIDALDPSESYLVYCRSGNRSAIAARQMIDAGFSDVVDGGGLDALSGAGVPTQ